MLCANGIKINYDTFSKSITSVHLDPLLDNNNDQLQESQERQDDISFFNFEGGIQGTSQDLADSDQLPLDAPRSYESRGGIRVSLASIPVCSFNPLLVSTTSIQQFDIMLVPKQTCKVYSRSTYLQSMPAGQQVLFLRQVSERDERQKATSKEAYATEAIEDGTTCYQSAPAE